MKALSISGFLISLLCLAAGLYNQFVYVPKENALKGMSGDANIRLWFEMHHNRVLIGEIVLIAGVVGLILCLIPTIKQKKSLAIVGAVFALGAIVLGLMQGTHVFS